MHTSATRHMRTRRLSERPRLVRLPTAAAIAFAAAATFAAPAAANPIDDAFIGALDTAGVTHGGAAHEAVLARTVCPMLAEQGGTFASAASRVGVQDNLSPEMAATFTSIAISMYCPSAMTRALQGNLPDVPQIPGVPAF